MNTPIRNCIRCDFCAPVCPEQLQPQQLYAFSRAHQHEQAQLFDLMQCTECGACESVCPSGLPLVAVFRDEKLVLGELRQGDAEAAHWQLRFERHQARSQQEAVSQQERKLKKLQAKSRDLAAGKSISKPAQQADTSASPAATRSPEQLQAEIAAAVARTRARKAALQQRETTDNTAPSSSPGPADSKTREQNAPESNK